MAPRAGFEDVCKYQMCEDGGSVKRADTPSNTPRVPVHFGTLLDSRLAMGTGGCRSFPVRLVVWDPAASS
jgi:hypothetical protein